jgi:hypothetical protein
MTRTALMLPEDLKTEAENAARAQGISLGEMVRLSLRKNLDSNKVDPFFSDTEAYGGKVPADLSKNHDKYLYHD